MTQPKRKIYYGAIIGRALCLLILAFLLIISIYPVIWLLISSFKTQTEFTLNSVFSLPGSFSAGIENYVDAWTTGNMGTAFINSVVCTAGSMVLIILTALPISFAIAKMQWKHSNKVATYITFGLLIPAQVALIPLFSIYNNIGLTNSRIGLILLYTAQSLPLSVMLFTGFFTAIPNEMMEAAVIDGCSIYQMLVKVIFPLMMNSIMTVLTLQFMSSWNDLIYSQTFISLAEKRTLQTALIMFNGSHGEVNWGPLFAAMSITIIPTLIIYMFLSKFMIRGMTSGAVKG